MGSLAGFAGSLDGFSGSRARFAGARSALAYGSAFPRRAIPPGYGSEIRGGPPLNTD